MFQEMTGGLPDVVTACVGGGSNAMGIFSALLNDPCELWGVEPMGRVQYTTADDQQSLEAFFKLSRQEGIIPALESAHAVAFAIKKATEMKRGSILVNLSGRGDKDLDFVSENYGFGD